MRKIRKEEKSISFKQWLILGSCIILVLLAISISLYMKITSSIAIKECKDLERPKPESKILFEQSYKLVKQNKEVNSLSDNLKGDGKLITDTSLNPWQVPLYTGTTIDANKLGIGYWEIDFDSVSVLSEDKEVKSMPNDNRSKVGSTYMKVNYGTDSKVGKKLPYTEVDGRISIALPWRYMYEGASDMSISAPDSSKWTSSTCAGRYVDIVFTDGTVLAGIIGDAKSTEKNKYNSFRHTDGSIIEVVGYTDLPYGGKGVYSDIERWKYEYDVGNSLGIKTFKYEGIGMIHWYSMFPSNKQISKIIMYDIQYYTAKQGEKAWFTGE